MPPSPAAIHHVASPLRLHLVRPARGWTAQPLETLTLCAAGGQTLAVCDGAGIEYFRAPAAPEVSLVVGGALGDHTVRLLDEQNQTVDQLTFAVDARTSVRDEGRQFEELLQILHRTMYGGYEGGFGEVPYEGRKYPCFVHWILDHSHTAKGMQYFSPDTPGLVELLALAQRQDGMIWSNANRDPGPGYWDSAYGPYGYARREKGCLLVRQPVENHCEYNFVDAMYLAWKASGDDPWLGRHVEAGIKALDYTVNDRARWSSKLGLLKRGYTIDSWDFQVQDQYAVDFPLGTEQLIDPDRTKFGVFFGDNHGYALACDQLAEMLEHLGRKADAARFHHRGQDIRQRLADIAWNGRFFTHRIEEDPTVRRQLGVDEKSQIAMSNAYALNRGIPHPQAVAILQTYLDLKAHRPVGSPGEFYAIYPPFEKGFGPTQGKWQYMNGGVHGHAAGELARGAFAHGYEEYGADILRRLLELGRRHGGKIYFAYTGAETPELGPQVFTPVDISGQANMDLWDQGGPGVPGWMGGAKDNDLRNLPVGRQMLAQVPYLVPDPQANGRRGALAVADKKGLARQVEVPIHHRAGAVYLLHTVGGVGPSQVAGTMSFSYEDGSTHTLYLQSDKHLCGWWFPLLKTPTSGVAWRGPNLRSSDVGVCWAVIRNPHPDKVIEGIIFRTGLDGATYAVMGVTLADRMPDVKPGPVSFGGPDNWAGGLCTAALMEGLAGIHDDATRYQKVELSPRWVAAEVGEAAVTARYAASQGYVAYRYRHDPARHTIDLTLTGSGQAAQVRLLLPRGAHRIGHAAVDGQAVAVSLEKVENSAYAIVSVALGRVRTVSIRYAG